MNERHGTLLATAHRNAACS